MFWHNLYYEIKSSLRVKDLVFWLMIFPVLLGTLFKIGFSGLYEKDTTIEPIPTAIVETEKNEIFAEVIKSVSDSENALLKPEYLSEEEALNRLKKGKVTGIIYSGDDITLTVADEGMKQSILKTFLEQYRIRERIITDTLENDPAKLPAVIESLSEEIAATEETPIYISSIISILSQW